MTRMCSSYTFSVDALLPQLPQYSGNKMTATRTFRVPCQFAEEFALRQIGKYYGNGAYTVPQLPARYPTDLSGSVAPPYRQLNMVATSFSIATITTGTLNSTWRPDRTDLSVYTDCIKDPESPVQMERGFAYVFDPEDDLIAPTIFNSGSCKCHASVQINYEEPPWHCAGPTEGISDPCISIMNETALSVEKSASYEMYTVPNRSLRWKTITTGDRNLKGDSYATIIVPKQDITVDWHNVPVASLCEIESRLASLRGAVNSTEFKTLSGCMCFSQESTGCSDPSGDCGFERDTVLFVNWTEELQFRTKAFRKMNTTTLRLHFKQKPVYVGGTPEYAGWNHLFCDRVAGDVNVSPWQEVEVAVSAGSEPLYKREEFNTMFGNL